ncbi:FAD-binding oxidoreductase [Pacificibacter marinus]|uniref:Putative FAD-linked oxidoreductase n=1 Tax=Pacificibacter marinus TaxID=658057 RepID=A0A1Y5RG71_9RHOB|nr:FAD-binding oxidoreductase [Pacificibacter marinus]SEK21904.1 FAD/FMN-containing dehydrogenase [Pacificibacter marinus]SLN15859.1 putative FAD-linked oxidoreductase [Pacificibacter marinus]
MTPNISAAKAALSHLDMEENPATVRNKSRDFFWYSPVLKAELDHLEADFVINPKTEEEIIEILKVCYAHDVPVTMRGGGTGNYGQAIPLAGGCVIHTTQMNKVKEIGAGYVVVEPGAIIKEMDAEIKEKSGQELRMFPSTYAQASIGGFVAGGSGGVGSANWGALRDLGNINRLRVVTMEEEPRILEFTGEELHRVSHAYGTNGIITEIELPLAPAYEWVEMFVRFDTFRAATEFSGALTSEPGILIKLASVYAAPIAHSFFQRVKPYVTENDHLVGVMVAPHNMDGFMTLLGRHDDGDVIYRSDDLQWARSPGPMYEFGWNHTTLRALKFNKGLTYLQVRYGGDVDKVVEAYETFKGKLHMHLEVMREGNGLSFAGLPIVEPMNKDELDQLVADHEAMECMIFNPHRYTLEEGGRQSTDKRQIDFKREADPKGLLNPGKMIAWDEPDFDYADMYSYKGMRPKPEATE